jgi:hypothetical protein
MARSWLGGSLALVLLAAVSASAAERMTDEQVKKLIEDIDDGYKAWKNDLEKKNLDDAVITSAERTVKVRDFLKDFEEAIDTLQDRFKPEYAASPEVMALLRKGSDVELRNRRQGETATSSSAWNALAAKLAALGQAYQVGWPVESMQVLPARLNDRELSAKVESMEKASKTLRDASDKAAKANKAIDKPTRESLKGSIEKMEQQSKDVRSRIEDDRPGAVEVGQLLDQASTIRALEKKLALASANAPAWQAIDAATEALARAYDLKKP